ncbi:MAG: DUF1003 domain-containing protein [Chloroflexota bacterium]|nr:DUF1003 domain-containing protein [Chloroflexota bacterium]
MATSSARAMTQPDGSFEERASDAITAFCGKMLFVYVHVVAFAIWIGTRGFGEDAFPFNFLTMTVSLEAIFLSTFILISQNRQQAQADERNAAVQEKLQQMLQDVITDEKLDLQNERMIGKLLERLDVERVRPIAEAVADIKACVLRLEASGGARPS